jgi:hypothetical protein
MEVLEQDLEKQPDMSRDTIKAYVNSVLAGMTDYANFLRNLQQENSSDTRIISKP